MNRGQIWILEDYSHRNILTQISDVPVCSLILFLTENIFVVNFYSQKTKQ